MKKQIILLGFFFLMIGAVAFKTVTQQEKNNNKKEQQQNQQKKQDKGTKPDKANPGKNDNKGQPAGKKDQDNPGKNAAKDNQGKSNDPGHANYDMKDGYKWNQETFKDRNKFKNQEKVTLCHKFNSGDEPAVTIRVSSSALKAHMNHGDVMGDCPAITNSRFSNIFLRNRTDYYNNLEDHYEQVSYSRSILEYALARLTNSRQQLVIMQNGNYPVADINRKQAVVVELEQNVSLLEQLIGLAANLVVNKLL
jgi:hypothetical protein